MRTGSGAAHLGSVSFQLPEDDEAWVVAGAASTTRTLTPSGTAPTSSSVAASGGAGDRDGGAASVHDRTLTLSSSIPAQVVRGEMLYPPIPPLDAFLRDASYHTMAQSREFEDINLSGAAAGFVTYQPLTMLFRRWPFRMFIFLVAGFFSLYAFVYGFGFLTPDLEASYDLVPWVSLAAAVPGAILWAAPFIAICGYPRQATITVGIALLSSALLLSAVWAPPALEVNDYRHFADTVVSVVMELIVATTFLFKEEWWWRCSLVICLLCFLISGVFLLGYMYWATVRKLILPAAIWVVMVLLFIAVRWWSLKRADAATKPDLLLYSAVWEKVEEEHKDDLIELAAVVSRLGQNRAMQPHCNLGQIYKQAFSLNGWYQAVVRQWAQSVGERAVFVPVKSLPRTLEKVHRSYKGKFKRVLDIVRSTIVVDDICHVSKVLQCVMRQAILHQVKNRFDLGYDAARTAGYRDLNCQLSFVELVGTPYEGFVFELQIHYAPILALKNAEGHKRYIHLRNLRGD